MFDLIIASLIEIGILSADFKHYKKIERKEQQDCKRRTLSKYLLLPSVIAFVILIGLALLAAPVIISTMNRNKLQNTTRELMDIKETLEEWKIAYTFYPSKLEEITIGRPLRNEWLSDAWGQLYAYQLSKKKDSFLLKSSGPDKVFGNSDDLEIN